MRITFLLLTVFLAACTPSKQEPITVPVSGKTNLDSGYLTIGKDTLNIDKGSFSDTIQRPESQYNYLKLEAWDWPKIVYLETGEELKLDFQNDWLDAGGDNINTFLLNKDSILSPYSAKWSMTEGEFKEAWAKEFPENLAKIDAYFSKLNTPQPLVDELKQMEYMLRGHMTANFISFQERKGVVINRDIYDFVDEIDLNNKRLGFHENNRNFQYYYYLDKVDEDLPDSLYPFAAIDTVNKYVEIPDIKNMIIRGVVKSGLYSEEVDHKALIAVYDQQMSEVKEDDGIHALYKQLQELEPGKMAPDFGRLESLNGDSVSIGDLLGKPVLISAWGTWCPYCREELPHLKKLLHTYADKLVGVAISLDSDRQAWMDYIDENDWDGTHLIDQRRGSTFRKNYLISGTNVHYLIDKEGKIVSRKLKPSDPVLAELIEGLDGSVQ